jgi:hypothetical protein
MAQQGVALPERALHIKPNRVETLFHVEHTPIEKLSPTLRAAFQELECVGIDQLQG